MIVDRTLKLWRSTPFVWGQSDCMLSIGDYVASAGGKDVTALFRGLYASEAGALDQMGLHGGMAGFAALAGLQVATVPQRGHVIALATSGGMDHIGALCTGDGVAARLERGVIEVNLRHIKIIGAWSL